MLKDLILRCIHEEIVETTGCTDPGVVAYAASKAASLLEGDITSVTVNVSNNVYKNGVMVGIPGTSVSGMNLAAAMGIYLKDHAERALSVMEYVSDDVYAQAQKLLATGVVSVKPQEDCPDPLYVHAIVKTQTDTAEVIIAHDYDYIIQIVKNDEVLLSRPIPEDAGSSVDQLLGHSVEELYNCIEDANYEEFAFLLEHAQVNLDSLKKAKEIIPPEGLLPPAPEMPMPYSMMHLAKENTFCLAKARMIGLKLPVIAVTGSGNHGITSFIGTMTVASTLGIDQNREKLLKALAICIITVVYIKGYIKRMTAFCGCTVAASTGVCAATTYMLGGNYSQICKAIDSLLCSLCGILCDGAKETCAFKLSTGVSSAIEYAWLAVNNNFGPPPVNGILSGTIEKTFAAMGRINNPGMTETDKVLVKIVSENDEASR